MNEIKSFYLNLTEPNRSCLLALRAIILNQDPLITESRKYGMPCFSYKRKMFCFLWKDKSTDEPYILFVEGNYLAHPSLEKGNRARMKILKVYPNADIELETIQIIINEALDLYRNGIIKLK